MATLVTEPQPVMESPVSHRPGKSSPPRRSSLFERDITRHAVIDALKKLDPRTLWRNPVIFVVEVGAVLTSIIYVQALVGANDEPAWFGGWISAWLWFTVIFANFAEAIAEGRGKAQAATLRKTRQDTMAKEGSACGRTARRGSGAG
jgi:K+-transporting ATPase ATPase B chain